MLLKLVYDYTAILFYLSKLFSEEFKINEFKVSALSLGLFELHLIEKLLNILPKALTLVADPISERTKLSEEVLKLVDNTSTLNELTLLTTCIALPYIIN